MNSKIKNGDSDPKCISYNQLSKRALNEVGACNSRLYQNWKIECCPIQDSWQRDKLGKTIKKGVHVYSHSFADSVQKGVQRLL